MFENSMKMQSTQSFWQVLEKIVACGQAALPDKTLENQNKMARNFKIADFTYMTLELWWVWVMSGNDEGGVRPSYWGRLQGFVKA